jgi:hypothetical protein
MNSASFLGSIVGFVASVFMLGYIVQLILNYSHAGSWVKFSAEHPNPYWKGVAIAFPIAIIIHIVIASL